MVDILILLILFIGGYSGYKKGLIIKLIESIGYLVTIKYALDYYKILSEYLYLLIPFPTPFAPESNPYLYYDASYIFTMDSSYYHIISFLTIFFIGWMIVKFLVKLISYTLERLPTPEPLNGLGGALLGFILTYISVFFILILLSTIPYAMVQKRLIGSSLANGMITSTPKISEIAYERFIKEANEEAISEFQTLEIQIPKDAEN